MPIEVDYRFAKGIAPRRHAEQIAIGQTAGTWTERHTHRDAQLRAHLATVVRATEDNAGSTATVSFPESNVAGDVGSLLTMIFGKYSMAGAAKVAAIRLPEHYGTQAKLGIDGIRRLTGVHDRPLIMAIFKPALGLSAQDHAAILQEVGEAGLDIIKDDEILPDLPSASTLDRLQACRPVLETRRAQGREFLYAVNVTGRADTLLARARELVAAGANALLLNVLSYGFSVLESLARDPAVGVPIFAHPALAGAWCGAPHHGFSYPALLGTCMAHAGADAVLYPAAYGSLPFSRDDEHDIRDILRGRSVFPVPSAGIHPGVVPNAVADYGADVILNAGTGIMDHPDGPAAGVHAFHEAWARTRAGEPVTFGSVPPGPLRRALEKWGPR